MDGEKASEGDLRTERRLSLFSPPIKAVTHGVGRQPPRPLATEAAAGLDIRQRYNFRNNRMFFNEIKKEIDSGARVEYHAFVWTAYRALPNVRIEVRAEASGPHWNVRGTDAEPVNAGYSR